MARWISVGAVAGCIAIAGAAWAQDVDEPNWIPTVSGPPEAMSVEVPDALPAFDGSTPVEIPFEIDQPATVYAAVYTKGFNPPAVPFIPNGRWDNDAQGMGGRHAGCHRPRRGYQHRCHGVAHAPGRSSLQCRLALD